MPHKNIVRSHIFNGLTELPRLGLEMGEFLLNRKEILKDLPHGEGQPVLFLPGFLTSDKAMAPLRKVFDELGYNTLGWECGVNWGSSPDRVVKLKERFEDLIKEYPDQKISLIGWSLGGIYARELARTYPNNVKCVITMGTPFAAAADQSQINPVFRSIYEAMNPKSPLITDEELRHQAMLPPPVPTTSLFSKADGIVNWRASLNPSTPLSENLDITENGARGSALGHTGMKVNKAVITIIADRLSQKNAATWRPFPIEEYPALNTYNAKAIIPSDPVTKTRYRGIESQSSRLFKK